MWFIQSESGKVQKRHKRCDVILWYFIKYVYHFIVQSMIPAKYWLTVWNLGRHAFAIFINVQLIFNRWLWQNGTVDAAHMCNPFSNNAVIPQNLIDIVEQNWEIFSIWHRFLNETRDIHISEIRMVSILSFWNAFAILPRA